MKIALRSVSSENVSWRACSVQNTFTTQNGCCAEHGRNHIKIRQGQEDLTVVQYDSPLSVAQAKQALLEQDTSWIGALQEEGS